MICGCKINQIKSNFISDASTFMYSISFKQFWHLISSLSLVFFSKYREQMLSAVSTAAMRPSTDISVFCSKEDCINEASEYPAFFLIYCGVMHDWYIAYYYFFSLSLFLLRIAI
jgi:hypothetical protein